MGGTHASETGETSSLRGAASRRPKLSTRQTPARNALARWQQRQPVQQCFAVVRHAERADSLCAFYHGLRWTQTEDFQRWPVDPPLSDAGVEGAREVARRVREAAAATCAPIYIVVTSPYFRCVQTAAEVCRELGPGTRVLVDKSLGEVFGPTVLGPTQPACPGRPAEQLLAYCRNRGAKCFSKFIGEWPAWPEDLRAARRRYANRFLTYLQRSALAKRNFALVTHADCVGAALSVMPSQLGKNIESVDYGGCFFAVRTTKGTVAPSGPRRSGSLEPALPSHERRSSCPSGYDGVCPGRNDAGTEPAEEQGDETDIDSPTLWRSHSNPDMPVRDNAWAVTLGEDHLQSPSSRTDQGQVLRTAPEPPQPSDGWRVTTHGIIQREKHGKTAPNSLILSKRVHGLVKTSKYSREEIEKLLGEMSEQPLGDSESQTDAPDDPRMKTHISLSTYLFGVSDYNSEYSDTSPRCSSWHLTEASLDGLQSTPDAQRGDDRPSHGRSASFGQATRLPAPARHSHGRVHSHHGSGRHSHRGGSFRAVGYASAGSNSPRGSERSSADSFEGLGRVRTVGSILEETLTTDFPRRVFSRPVRDIRARIQHAPTPSTTEASQGPPGRALEHQDPPLESPRAQPARSLLATPSSQTTASCSSPSSASDSMLTLVAPLVAPGNLTPSPQTTSPPSGGSGGVVLKGLEHSLLLRRRSLQGQPM